MKRARTVVTQWVVPALLLSASFMDPGNYVSAVSAGTMFKYQQLIPLLLSHVAAGALQHFSVILGVETRLSLSENCQRRLSYNACSALNIVSIFVLILTDMCQVIGSTVALEILFDIAPLPAILLCTIDVSLMLRFHSSAFLRQATEMVVALFSLIIFSLIFLDLFSLRSKLSIKDIFRGAGPSFEMLRHENYLVSLSLFGSTAMPHSLFLVSEMAKMRITEHQSLDYPLSKKESQNFVRKLTVRLVLVGMLGALVLNSSLIILSAALAQDDDSNEKHLSGLRDVYHLLSESLSRNAGTFFLYMLLLSGQSFGFISNWVRDIVQTGMFDSREDHKPFLVNVPIRYISVLCCFTFVWFGGEAMLTLVINATQVILSVVLVLVATPLVIFVTQNHLKK